MPPQKYYAIARGKTTGIFTSWGECQPLVNGYNGARYKSFATQAEAAEFIRANGGGGGGGGESHHAATSSSYSYTPSSYVPTCNASTNSGATPSYGASSSSAPSSTSYSAPPRKYYAVARGSTTGVFNTWYECQPHIEGYAGARFKSFGSMAEAEAFVREEGAGASAAAAAWACGGTTTYKYAPSTAVVARATAPPPASSSSASHSYYGSSTPSSSYGHGGSSTASHHTTTAAASSSSSNGLPPPLVVYTDGACPNNGSTVATARAGYGVHFPRNENHDPSLPLPADISRPVPSHMKQTNNVGELMAVIAGVRSAVERDGGIGAGRHGHYADPQHEAGAAQPLKIYTDSKYCIDGVTKWMEGWAAKGWRLKSASSKGGSGGDGEDGGVKNVELWQELDGLLKARREQMTEALVAKAVADTAGGGDSYGHAAVGHKRGRSGPNELSDADMQRIRSEAARTAAANAVQFVHVRGHQGNAGNEMADKLAVMGAIGR